MQLINTKIYSTFNDKMPNFNMTNKSPLPTAPAVTAVTLDKSYF